MFTNSTGRGVVVRHEEELSSDRKAEIRANLKKMGSIRHGEFHQDGDAEIRRSLIRAGLIRPKNVVNEAQSTLAHARATGNQGDLWWRDSFGHIVGFMDEDEVSIPHLKLTLRGQAAMAVIGLGHQ